MECLIKTVIHCNIKTHSLLTEISVAFQLFLFLQFETGLSVLKVIFMWLTYRKFSCVVI